jgi:uncharacterized protein (DUF952 family)
LSGAGEGRPWPDAEGAVYHLTPVEVWERQASGTEYMPEAYEADGFIHCTIGETNLVTVANAFYQADARAQVALVLDLDRVTAPVRFEDEGRIYPHVHGPLDVAAVVGTRRAVRAADGSFLGFE